MNALKAPGAKLVTSLGNSLLRSSAKRDINSTELGPKQKELLGTALVNVGKRWQQAWPELKTVGCQLKSGNVTVSQVWYATKVGIEAYLIYNFGYLIGRAYAGGINTGYDYEKQLLELD